MISHPLADLDHLGGPRLGMNLQTAARSPLIGFVVVIDITELNRAGSHRDSFP